MQTVSCKIWASGTGSETTGASGAADSVATADQHAASHRSHARSVERESRPSGAPADAEVSREVSRGSLPFDAVRLARSENPETSKAAARACKELRGEQHDAILRVLLAAKQPMTACAVADGTDGWLNLDKHQVGRRLGELVVAGYAVVADELGVTDTGRRARRYALATLNSHKGGEAQ